MSAAPPLLGVIADDFTGATDVASMLVRSGLRTVQTIGVPQEPAPTSPAPTHPHPLGTPERKPHAIVIALKSRTIAPADAVAQSLAALRWLQSQGVKHIYFKVCSTFDSTPAGNIGPVAQALREALGQPLALVCPAFPENGRTVYRGHLFVGDQLLSDSSMRHHPLTPMTDANLVRVLQAQTPVPVGLLRHDEVTQGAAFLRRRLAELKAQGMGFVVADAVRDADLHTLGEAIFDQPLLVAGSGLAIGLPEQYARSGWLERDADAATLDAQTGLAAVLAGSCSQATLGQIARWLADGRAHRVIDPLALARDPDVVGSALAWAREALQHGPVLMYASAAPEQLRAIQSELGTERSAQQVEAAMAALARGLRQLGVQRFVVAGGETSGAVVQALGVQRLRIGHSICPGVPWTQADDQADGPPLWLALKSGNFGGEDFFAQALAFGAAPACAGASASASAR